ncbi:hypothetical protein [Singulisphaera acidiphila]|uniref:Uncharacterized protein n=1 Tax=Singulisphaera acidiphila (strain ATCC BAA-1392 / DSM 18658 / VKM B-2454 / MOB10) TaxID=886293 RepID=L0DGP0_SINAD|nr:hypothetical protein [Singulisphaera acidiphila]AGA27973.1 hypothetical protein Sinac_3735 [Singulisphaera acidiphila DSM 18658]
MNEVHKQSEVLAGSAHRPATAADPRRRLMARVLVSGLLAGLIAGAVGEAIHGRFDPEAADPNSPGASSHNARHAQGQRIEATLIQGTLGGFLGLGLGLATARPVRRSVAGGTAGLILGLAAGAGSVWWLLPRYLAQGADQISRDLFVAAAFHSAFAVALGTAAGAAFGIGIGGGRQILKAAIGGLIGAVAGACLVQIGGACLFPVDQTYSAVPLSLAARLFARLTLAISIALGAVLLVSPENDPS